MLNFAPHSQINQSLRLSQSKSPLYNTAFFPNQPALDGLQASVSSMKIIEVDDQLYQFIASKTERIGEDASDILRRLLGFEPLAQDAEHSDAQPEAEKPAEVEAEPAPEVEAAPETVEVEVAEAPQVVESVEAEVAPVAVEQAEAAVKDKPKPKAKAKKAPRKVAKGKVDLSPVELPEPSDMLAALDFSSMGEKDSVVNRFVNVLAVLAQAHSDGFEQVLEIRAKKLGTGPHRLYFSRSLEEMTGSGNSTNAKPIGESGFWVMTNSNTDRKKWMLSEVAKRLGYSEDDIRILTHKLTA